MPQNSVSKALFIVRFCISLNDFAKTRKQNHFGRLGLMLLDIKKTEALYRLDSSSLLELLCGGDWLVVASYETGMIIPHQRKIALLAVRKTHTRHPMYQV